MRSSQQKCRKNRHFSSKTPARIRCEVQSHDIRNHSQHLALLFLFAQAISMLFVLFFDIFLEYSSFFKIIRRKKQHTKRKIWKLTNGWTLQVIIFTLLYFANAIASGRLCFSFSSLFYCRVLLFADLSSERCCFFIVIYLNARACHRTPERDGRLANAVRSRCTPNVNQLWFLAVQSQRTSSHCITFMRRMLAVRTLDSWCDRKMHDHRNSYRVVMEWTNIFSISKKLIILTRIAYRASMHGFSLWNCTKQNDQGSSIKRSLYLLACVEILN